MPLGVIVESVLLSGDLFLGWTVEMWHFFVSH
jgi:hypothetical protein